MKKLLLFAAFVFASLLTVAQTITVTLPNGGETYTSNVTNYIVWEDDNQGQVKLEYSADNGANWVFISNATSISGTGFYTWTVPLVSSINCLVRVTYVNFPLVSDVSDGVFEIQGPSITIFSPNGNENYGVGAGYDIYWSSPGVDYVDISYSIDNGLNYTLIAGNIDGSFGNYYWSPIPNTVSNLCLIKIEKSSNASLYDISDGVFEISNPSVTVDYPNGGEVLYTNSQSYISWQSVGLSLLNLEYSINNGTTWTLIADSVIASNGYYNWDPLPATVSANYLVRVSSIDNAAAFDQSDAAFSIIAGGIFLFAPDGGQIIPIGSLYQILWYSQGINEVDVAYSIDSMQTWLPIVNNYVLLTSYDWMVPATPSAHCFVRIMDSNNSNTFITSNSQFEISGPQLQVLLPNGGETFTSGINTNINIFTVGVDSVKVEYSIDGGNNWLLINPAFLIGFGNNYYIPWLVPNTPSTNALIRISDAANISANDVSNFPFSIVTGALPECLVDFFPANGLVDFGINPRISWLNSNFQQVVTGYDVYFGTNPNPPLVTANTQDLNYTLSGLTINTVYYWKIVPIGINGSAAGCIVNSFTTHGANIYTMDTVTSTVCNASFYDSGGPLFNYDLNESYIKTFYPASAGQTLKLNFNTFQLEDYWDRMYLYDGTSTAAPLIYNTFFTNNLSPGQVVATNPLGAITISFSSNQFYDSYSGWDASFSCVPFGSAALAVTSPYCNENWIAGTTHAITWNSTNITTVNIDYTIDGGVNWLTVATNVPSGAGIYNWTVPQTVSTNCLVRVTDANNATNVAVSDCPFEIQYVPVYVDLTAPNGGETFLEGTTNWITWQSMFVTNVNIEYSIDAGATYNSIVANLTSNDGYNQYLWTVPNTPSNLCLVRISDASNTAVNNSSQGAFYIVAPNLSIMQPNGGETIDGATYYNIDWTGYIPTGGVQLEYSTDNGSNWTIIANNVSHYNGGTNYYNWFVPNVTSANCRVKVSQQSNLSVTDESNATFIIVANSPVITINQPNGGENLIGGSNYLITWNSAYTSGSYKIEFSSNGGSAWSVLNANITNSGYYNWMVPNSTNSANCLIKVSDNQNLTIFDESNTPFSIGIAVPAINLTSPIGGEVFYALNNHYITWNSALVNNVNLEYSTNGGNTWLPIVANLLNANFYNWTVPNTISTNCLMRITDANNTNVISTSVNPFSIESAAALLTIHSPNGGESLFTGTFYNIEWSGASAGAIVSLEYSIDAGINWDTIINTFAFSNYNYNWLVPNTVSNQCLIRITSATNTLISDISNGVFSIVAGASTVAVNSPNGGEYLTQGYWHNITWSRNNAPLIDVSYSIDNGANWNILADSLNANSYYWLVPNISSNLCLVRVNKTGAPAVIDQSDANFTIGPFLPNGNGIVIDSIVSIPFCKLDTFYVYYTANGIYNLGNSFDVQLSDSVGNFNNNTLIGQLASTANNGVIACVVPATVGNGLSYRIRIQSTDLPSTSIDNGIDIVINSPQFDFAANNLINYLPNGSSTFFIIPAQLPTVTYNWTFGDGGTSTANNPTHAYSQIGYFDVTLTVEDISGCSLTVTKPNYIRVEQLFPSYGLNTNTSANIRGVSFLTPDTGVFVMDNGDCLVTYDGGVTLNNSVTGLVNGQDSLRAVDVRGGKWRIAGTNGIIKESTDLGQTWILMQTSTTERLYGVATYDDNNAFAVGDNGVIMNYDGTSWVMQNTGATNRFWNVTVDTTAAVPTAYAVGSGGSIFKYDGTSWAPLSSGLGGGLFGSAAIGNNVIYAVGGIGLSNGVITKTTDAGLNWNVVLSGVDVTFRSVTGIADTAWACATNGIIYETRNSGTTWVRYSVGDTYENTGINFRSSKGYVTGPVGHARGFGINSPDTTVGIKKIFTPSLFEIYPNPATDRVAFETNIYSNARVKIVIRDIDGQLVEVVNDSSLPIGKYRTVIKTNKLKSGVYFVHVDDGNYSFAKKLVIVK